MSASVADEGAEPPHRAGMLLAAIAAVPALQTAPRGQTIGRGTVHVEGVPTGPGNLLPPLTHMFGGGESITHLDPTQLRPAMRHSTREHERRCTGVQAARRADD